MTLCTRHVAAFVLVVLASTEMPSTTAGAARRTDGVPKSASAFAKFVAEFIQQAMPTVKVAISGRLRLDVETPSGGHTTDLHNIYSFCQRNREDCPEELTAFVAASIAAYRGDDNPITRAKLRIVVRPSGYIAAVQQNAKRNRPIASPLAGDDWMMVVGDEPTAVIVMDEDDLPRLKLTARGAFDLAMANTRAALHQSMEEELAKGLCRGILGGDHYTSSTVALHDLWAKLAHACHDNLIVAIPAADVVVYADGSERGALQSLDRVTIKIIAQVNKPFSDLILRWSKAGWDVVSEGAAPPKSQSQRGAVMDSK